VCGCVVVGKGVYALLVYWWVDCLVGWSWIWAKEKRYLIKDSVLNGYLTVAIPSLFIDRSIQTLNVLPEYGN